MTRNVRVAVVASAQIFGGFQNLPPPQSLDFSAFFGLSHLFPPRLSISVIFDTDLVTSHVGAGLTTREDQHVSMDILQGAFARWPKLRAAHYLITRIIVFGFMIYLIGPSLELIERAGNSTATSVVWLPKSVIYASFLAGIISVNLSLLGQVPRKVYNIIHGIESDELLLEAQAMAKEFDRELEAEAAKDSDDNADNAGKDGGKKE